MMIQMRDDKICLSEQPENLAKRNSIDKCSWKKSYIQEKNMQRSFVPSNSVQMTNFSGQLKKPIRKLKIRRRLSIV